ncbi:MAG: hypothetical protein ACR2PG_07875 [Hyphomicrobiaceae bacterium]
MNDDLLVPKDAKFVAIDTTAGERCISIAAICEIQPLEDEQCLVIVSRGTDNATYTVKMPYTAMLEVLGVESIEYGENDGDGA